MIILHQTYQHTEIEQSKKEVMILRNITRNKKQLNFMKDQIITKYGINSQVYN
jgi:hypothetical protein